MKLIRNLDMLPDELRGGAVAIGNFDGVHLGHARIVEQLLEHAQRVGGAALVLTFDPHPVQLLRPQAAPPPLTWTDRKAELLAELGVAATVAYPTDEALLGLAPENFFDQIVRSALDARALVEGPNFYFGKDRSGDISLLGRLCQQAGIELDIAPGVTRGGSLVSSSRIRALIRDGEVAAAAALLTRPYRLRGIVTHGARRGARIGFPTANVDGIDTLLPALGVYAGFACLDGRAIPAAIHFGPNPTFGEQARKCEVHLLDFAGDLYGRLLEVEFVERLRDVATFADTESLQQQLAHDVSRVRAICQRSRVRQGDPQATEDSR